MSKLFYPLIFLLVIIFPIVAMGQSDKEIALAEEYFKNGELEKAKIVFQKISKEPYAARIIHEDYLATLVETKNYDEAEKFLKRQIKSYPESIIYKADYGILLQKANKKGDYEKYINKLTEGIKSDDEKTEILGKYLLEKNNTQWALKLYLAARANSKHKTAYALALAQVYAYEAKYEDMIEEYINLALDNKNNNLDDVKNALQENLQREENYQMLETVLLSRAQKNPGEIIYSELLMWHYMQQKDFNKAFIQARSIDKRQKLEGIKLMEIGGVAMNNKDFKSAAIIYEYIANNYPASPIYIYARKSMIQAKEELVKNTYPVDIIQIQSLIADYKHFISQVGANQRSVEALKNMGVLYAFYLDKKDSALFFLNEAIKIGFSDNVFVGKCKLDMGDIYLLKNEPWEATLLYSQVEKSLTDQPLAYEAKLKNARLSFYKGDFELAKSHLDVLKLATSREIANDAMALSLLISDNLIADSTGSALREYSKVELLLFQNKNKEALANLTEMEKKYSSNTLIDEILWLRANTFAKLNENEKAINDLQKIVDNYGFDIYGDDAYFLMAKIYEEKLGQKEKAMELYKNYLEKYPGTIYIPEARKRFRMLRGDKLN